MRDRLNAGDANLRFVFSPRIRLFQIHLLTRWLRAVQLRFPSHRRCYTAASGLGITLFCTSPLEYESRISEFIASRVALSHHLPHFPFNKRTNTVAAGVGITLFVMTKPKRYLLYRATFETKRGTCRTYVGMTANLDARRRYMRKKPVSWLKCRGKSELVYEILQAGFTVKASALAAEAWFAAREIVRNKEAARGACWCNPTLTDEMWRECRAVAALESWTQVFEIALLCGRLDKHLTDASYIAKAADAPRPVRKRSGVCGNTYRKSLVDKGILKKKH